MLRGNLATRPFYNQRLVTLAILLVAVAALALAVYNVSALMSLTTQRNTLRGQIVREQNETTRVQAEAAALERSVDATTLRQLAGATREANGLIDARTFSWTGFFSLIEQTLPIDARLIAVSPKVDKGVFKVTMIVIARRREELAAFIAALQDTGHFYDVLPQTQQHNDDGTDTAAIEASYLPPEAPAATAAGSGGGKGHP
jgi:hypothetical protein